MAYKKRPSRRAKSVKINIILGGKSKSKKGYKKRVYKKRSKRWYDGNGNRTAYHPDFR